ncbi:MAG: 4Fe-4S cluster-binding domain-containing protein, partial [Candidatus Aminicenantes bacterium]|nr:4Fe-4S cluster-binding domain-containing protein [Candidatus Aminicenantes bacterium]NIN87417.1 4Fe-4S cluster-binding domain-containing protein [Candidatus Aminicenantes bacterium]NIQ69655.1 4Fe-4S cluster-binding domain-containing protein [Candidatus Aminicenantes bacterium]NIR08263.1 4Fe-4S cluster-binding domain-containing protein [Candidatus Aminicenantes bacterium]
MTEREYKVYVTPDGRQTVVDPDFDFIPLLPEDFKIISQPPPYDFVPSYQRTRKIVVPGLSAEDLSQINTHDLWKMHDRALKEGAMSSLSSGDLNLLDLKIELARREIQNCKLCGWMCAVNRFVQKGTYCGLEAEAFYSSLIAHIAEEPVITPCMMIKLLGCSLRCKTCNASEGLNLEQGKKLTKSVWDEMKEINGYEKTIALQLFGGNPDESVFSILRVLKGLSGDFKKPI